MNKYNPKVSIIIPVYNGSNFLDEAIRSALSQTYNNIEVIVVNDGSDDNGETERIANQYGERIKYLYKENGGVSSALNYGIRNMTGEWFSWLSHDDLYMPEKIERSIDVLCEQKTIDEKLIVYTDGCLIRENGAKIKQFKKYFAVDKSYSGIDAALIMTSKGALCGCCLLIHKNAFKEVGLFDESLRYSQDALMWYKLFMHGYSIYSCGGNYVYSRVHKKQVTNTRKDLFAHDSVAIVRILAPIFAENNPSSRIYYNYVKRATRWNCDDALKYLVEYAKENQILTEFELFILKLEKIKGCFLFCVKKLIRKIIT